MLLLSTDAASEGLNLQEHCRRVIHYELPFNPNRMLQRQGRVDRYGQDRPCRFAFLYAKDTYEGEVLARLFTKIEAQITRLGSIGDVLGAFQADRIEEMLARSPADVRAAIAAAERSIDEELSRVNDTHTQGRPRRRPAHRRRDRAAPVGPRRRPELERVHRRLRRPGGQPRRGPVPPPGRSDRRRRSAGLLGRRKRAGARTTPSSATPDAAPAGTPTDAILDEDHPLAQAAIRWVRGSRYDPHDDHRLAVRVLDTIDGPDLVATYIATLRAGDDTEMERLLAVRVGPDGAVDPADAAGLIHGQGVADVPETRVRDDVRPLVGGGPARRPTKKP